MSAVSARYINTVVLRYEHSTYSYRSKQIVRMENPVRMGENYSEHTWVQKRCVEERVVGYVRTCIEKMIAENPARFRNNSVPFHIVDLGTCDGLYLVPLAKEVIRLIREVNAELPIIITGNDTPYNDFNLFFTFMNRELGSEKNVFIYSVARSFYEPLTPPEEVDLFIAAQSVDWLPEIPVLTDEVCYFSTQKLFESEAGRAWAQKAREAWVSLFLRRQVELKVGGRFLMFCFILPEDDPTSRREIEINKKEVLLVRDVLRRRGLEKLFPYTLLPVYFRSKEEVLEVFKNKDCHLQQVEYDEFVIGSSVYEEYVKTGDAEAYKRRVVSGTRAVFENMGALKLLEQGVPKDIVDAINNEYFEKELYGMCDEVLEAKIDSARYFLLVAKK